MEDQPNFSSAFDPPARICKQSSQQEQRKGSTKGPFPEFIGTRAREDFG